MRGIKIKNEDLMCLIEDAIIYSNNTYSKIIGDFENGYIIEQPQSITKIENNGWSNLYPMLETFNNSYQVIAGETSWGGTGFIAVKNLKNKMIDWIIHLSTMNNPTNLNIENNDIHLITDLNYPHGIEFIIPIHKPEKFKLNELSDKEISENNKANKSR